MPWGQPSSRLEPRPMWRPAAPRLSGSRAKRLGYDPSQLAVAFPLSREPHARLRSYLGRSRTTPSQPRQARPLEMQARFVPTKRQELQGPTDLQAPVRPVQKSHGGAGAWARPWHENQDTRSSPCGVTNVVVWYGEGDLTLKGLTRGRRQCFTRPICPTTVAAAGLSIQPIPRDHSGPGTATVRPPPGGAAELQL